MEAFGTRWTVEQCFEEAKEEVGLDEYARPLLARWYRHMTLSMLILAFLTALRACEEENMLKKSLVHWTQPQNQKHLTLIISTHLPLAQ